MLNYKEIIKKMNTRQKLSLLAMGNITPPPLSSSGIATLEVCDLEKYHKLAVSEVSYPPLNSLSLTWDMSLVSKICSELAKRATQDNIAAVVTPDFSVRNHVYRSGMSEDPYYNSELLSACANGISSVGVMPIADGGKIDDIDLDCMDSMPDKNAIYDSFVLPFVNALSDTSFATLTDGGVFFGKENEVNHFLLSKYLDDIQNANDSDQSREVKSIKSKDGIAFMLNGSTRPLKDANDNYLKIKEDFDNGIITENEFEELILSDEVLKDDEIDAALERFFSFADRCKKLASYGETTKPTKPELLCLKAAEESLVLLKNQDGILPLSKKTSLAVVGRESEQGAYNPALSFLSTLTINGNKDNSFLYKGYASGYSSVFPNDKLIEDALAVSKDADTVLVFLSFDENFERNASENKCLKLPANQLALIDALSKANKKIIAVLCSDCAIDVSFDKACHGLFLLPKSGTYTAFALYNALKGEINPCGRLSYTLYDNTDERFGRLDDCNHTQKHKVGRFFGYRGYDTEGRYEKYPFGFGLSYTTFKYSFLKADKYGISVKLKNIGSCEGTEVVQVYIGKEASTAIRPKKELKKFVRVTLKAGESMTINMPLHNTDFYFFDSIFRTRFIESGKYTAYVGSSVLDIKLQKTFFVDGSRVKGNNQSLSDYLPKLSRANNNGFVLNENDSNTQSDETSIAQATTIEKMFLSEFENKKESNSDLQDKDTHNEDDIDSSITIKTVLESLTSFMNERGIMLPYDSVKSVVSAVLSSKLVIFKGNDTELLNEFVLALGSYFGEVSSVESLDNTSAKMVVLRAIENAKVNKAAVHSVALLGTQMLAFDEVIYPFVENVLNPYNEASMLFKGHTAKVKAVSIPSNLWLFASICDGQTLSFIDKEVLKAAVVCSLRLKRGEKKEDKALHKHISLNQVQMLSSDCLNQADQSEASWKKIDKIESGLLAQVAFRSDNKLLRKFERFSSVLLSLDTSESDALDTAFSSCILPLALHLGLNKKPNPLTKANYIDAIKQAFGVDNVKACQDVIKNLFD